MGWSQEAQIFTIPSGETGATVDPIEFERNYKALVVSCTDCGNIQAATDLTAQWDDAPDGTLCDLYEIDDPGTQWSKGSLPTSGTIRFTLTHSFGVRRLRLVLSQATSGGTAVFTVRGLDGDGG